jgi:hypothetical protein
MGLFFIWLLFLFGSMFGISASSVAQTPGSPVIDEVIFKDGIYEKSGVVSVPRRCPVYGPTECGNTSSMSVYVKGKKGDRISVSLTSRTGKAVFTVFSPDREPLENGSATTAWSGTFPSNGNFLITVYHRDGKGSTPFTLKILGH